VSTPAAGAARIPPLRASS